MSIKVIAQTTDSTKKSNNIIELEQECKLVLNANIDLADRLTLEIIQEIRDVMSKIQMLIPADSINIDLEITDYVIPIWGVAGVAKDDYNIWFGYNPQNENFTVDYILRGLTHEIHHVVCGRRPQQRVFSLLEQMIHEGLADHFMVEILGCEPPPWCVALTEQDIHRYLVQINPESRIEMESFDEFIEKYYQPWFFGTEGENQIVMWTGYSLSWYIVENYLREHPEESSSSLIWVNADTVVNSIPELKMNTN